MIQQRRGMLRVWSLALIIATFALTIFGTLLTRSGVLASVHSFGASSVGSAFIALLAQHQAEEESHRPAGGEDGVGPCGLEGLELPSSLHPLLPHLPQVIGSQAVRPLFAPVDTAHNSRWLNAARQPV